jgi:deoxyribonuclease V
MIHRWNISVEEALELQQQMRGLVRQTNGFELGEIKTVAGIDAAYNGEEGRAAVAVFSFPKLELIEQATAVMQVDFPYVPGLLSFREGPVALAALGKLKVSPDLLLFDGQGYAHPRRFGLACHLGVYLNKPTIGCAKTRLIGTHAEPGAEPGDYTLLEAEGEVIGAVLRTRPQTNPIFISVGHKIDLLTALEFVTKCIRGYRLPEPTRIADQLSKF